MDRYRNEVNRLYGVMNRRLADRPYLAGEYSIADMASYPWIVPWERQGQKLSDFPQLAALVRSHQGAAGGGQGLRVDAEDQSRPGRRAHRGRARDFVRPDRAVGRRGGAARAIASVIGMRACGRLSALNGWPEAGHDVVVIDLILPHDDVGADVHPVEQIDDVVVDQAEAA